jgi:arylsulfatase A-like enzyme
MRPYFILLALLALLPTSFAADRPNIVFAFADDWGRHAGVYAQVDGPGTVNDIIKTPNFDAVAKRGVLFKNAFVNAPSCTPCRSSLLSGMHFWQTGTAAFLQGAVWDSKIPTYPLILKDEGYHIGKTWKVWSPGTPRDAGYGGNAHNYSQAGSSFNGFSQTATNLIKKGKSVDEAKDVLLQQVRGNFQQFLGKRDGDKPFCYWFGPTNVHRKWIKGSGKALWGLNPDDLKGKMPPFLPDVPVVREDLADYFGEAMAFDAGLGVLIEELKKAGELDNTIIAVSGDHGAPGFPHGKCNLYDFGIGVPLAIAGPGVDGGRVVDDFVCLPDLAPTFLEAGGVKPPATMSARSIWPTLKSTKTGLVDPLRTQVFVGRERHVQIARAKQEPYPQRAVRNKDYSFIINFRPDRWPLGDPYLLGTPNEPDLNTLTNQTFCTLGDEDAGPTKAFLVTNRKEWKALYDSVYGKRPREELFDLKKDPHQMNNVAADPEYAEVAKALRKQLMNELERTNDPRLVDDGKFFETLAGAGTPAKLRQPKKKK